MGQKIIFRRWFAYSIDCCLIFGVYVASQYILLWTGVQSLWDISSNMYSYTFLTISLPSFLLISLIEVYTDGVTLGKYVTQLKVSRGFRPRWFYIIRNIPKFLVWEIFHIGFAIQYPDPTWWIIIGGYVYLIATVIPMFVTRGHKTLYDVVLGTQVQNQLDKRKVIRFNSSL